ncbi:TatD family hydrolase [Leptospira noguchii]|uniref:Hydrolase, TatD family n=1 Tax=Leptospira noguchii TaxID=28182 RepID=M6VIV2_9LEPT|nr:TatD family hydrolase [Leptospira noguchii]EMO53064.1 hydrolase, TatD family [Leptospira noguchii]MCH1913048.1 TatD family hydrolase [Leptospira noguchii]MCH1916797.1 TatD family hydrolase [Leptospira noguchii]UOG64072.1 TatD family hydrolase [Leptospira noguchii]
MVSIVDTHCHLDIIQSQGLEIADSLKNAAESGVKKIVQIGIDLESSVRARSIANEYSNDSLEIQYSIGCHPTETHEFPNKEEILQFVYENLGDPKLSAIGEIGLDYYHTADTKKQQKDILESFLECSSKTGLPVVIHSRDAKEDTISVLKNFRDRAFGVIHCFTYDYSTAKTLVDIGYYISFSGIVAFKNAIEIQEAAQKLPLECMLIETDAPFLAPPPFRGKRNEPSYMKFILDKMFSLRKESNSDVENKLFENSIKFINRKAYHYNA